MPTYSDVDLEERLLQEDSESDRSEDRFTANAGMGGQYDDDDLFVGRNRDEDLDLASELPPMQGAPFGMYLGEDGRHHARMIDPAVAVGGDETRAKRWRAERRQELAEQAQEKPRAQGLLIDEESEDGLLRDSESEPASESEHASESEAPANRSPAMLPDIAGGREMQAKTKTWNRVGEWGSTIQGKTNTARMRGEGRYGAAALHSVGNFLAKTGDGAAGITAAATLPVNLAGTLASPVKATVSKLVGAVGQSVEGVSDFAKDRIDPEALGEQQSLVDLANRHNVGQDSAGGGSGMTRREEADAYGIRFEKGDHAKRLWKGRKKRSAGRIAENFLSAPLRGLASVPMGIWKGAKSLGGLFANTLPKYGRKFGNWLGKNRFSTSRRGRKGFENMMAIGDRDEARKRQDAAYLGRDLGMMEKKRVNDDPDRIAKRSWLRRKIFKGPDKDAWRGKDDPRAWRGAEAQVRSAARTHLHATGRDLMLGRKEFNSLNAYERKMYKDVERNRVRNSPEYQKALDSQSTAAIELVKRQMAAENPSEQPPAGELAHESVEGQSQAEPKLIGEADPAADFEMPEAAATNPDLVPHEAKNTTSKLMATGQFLDEKVNVAKDKVLTLQKGAAQVSPVAKFLGEKVPAMLNSKPDLAEGYAPIQQGAQQVGDFVDSYVKKPMDAANKVTGIEQLPLVPLVSNALSTGADLIQTAAQYKHRNDDPNATGHHQRQGVKDLRTMLAAHQALQGAEADTGATEQQQRARVRRKLRTVMRLAVANKKLASAQTKAGLTARNEYSHKEEEFITSGKFQKDKTENSRLYNLFARKKASAPAPEDAGDQNPIVQNDNAADGGSDNVSQQTSHEPGSESGDSVDIRRVVEDDDPGSPDNGTVMERGPRQLSDILEVDNESSEGSDNGSVSESRSSEVGDHSDFDVNMMPKERGYSQGRQVERPTSFTNVPGLDFDQPLDDFMYDPEEVDYYQGKLRQKAVDAGQPDAPIPSHHEFIKGAQSAAYPDLADMERKKRVLDDQGVTNAVNPDLARHAGPTTVNGREVYPEYGAVDEPNAPFGGDWRDVGTNQILQNAGRTGDEEEKYREFRNNAVPEDRVLDLPAQGWDDLGPKPGLFAGKKAKADYRQRKDAATKVVGDAHRKVGREGMPDFIKTSPFGRKQWQAADNLRREQERLLKMKIMGPGIF